MKKGDELLHPLQPCSSCGRSPRASVEVGAGYSRGSIECSRCGIRTTPGLSYQQAWREWNALTAQQTLSRR